MMDEVSEYVKAVLDKDTTRAKSIIMALVEERKGPLEVFEVLAKAQVTIGGLWEAKTISVADEHFATQIALDLVPAITGHFRSAGGEVRKAVVFSCEGEFHNVGAQIFSSLLRLRGWSVEFLGVDFSVSRLLETLKSREKIDLFAVSVTMDFNLKGLADSLRRLRSDKKVGQVIVIVGGRLFESTSAREAFLENVGGRRLADHIASNVSSGLDYLNGIARIG